MERLDDGATDLRSGQSLWSALRPPGVETRAVKSGERLDADVVIVGAGITGAFLAERFTRAGRSVLMIDRRKPAKGSTAASTAMLQWELDAPFLELEDRLGFDNARGLCVQSRGAIATIGRLVRDNAIACGFAPRPSIFLAGEEMDAAGLREERRLRGHMGVEGDYAERPGMALLGFEAEAGLMYEGSAEVDPMLLALGLLRTAVRRGATILSPVTAERYDSDAGGVFVTTREGALVTGRTLVLANGYEIPEFVPASAHKITSSWALATRPVSPDLFWPGRALVWEGAEPYLYFRGAADGRIVVGGEDEETPDAEARDALTAVKTEAILAKLAARYPALAGVEAEYSWSGFFGETSDSLPMIGRVPGRPNCLAAFGYGGNGITFSAIAADMLEAELAGERHPNADLYALDRSA
ncbi:MAG: FAD-binding oxidoreductase [Alphaproteobacteria bacterium]|nr:FAD-binding oxidoreductase [Alphaproteobacteria bacterium]